MIRARVKEYPTTGKVTAFLLVASVVVRTIISAVISSPYLFHASISQPWQIHACIRDVAPPIMAGGFLYDRTTGALLYDSVTGAVLFA